MSLKRSPDFVGVPNLELLVLDGCASLTEIHPSLLNHKKLVLLSLKGCKRLKTLPCKIEMSSLKVLLLSGCCEFKRLPEFDECMKNLSQLYLEDTAITKLPSSLGFLESLTLLDLENCKNLVCLPDTICKLKSLLTLNVSGCSKIRSFPEGLKEIKSLEELLANETAIEELPSSVFYLENLKVISFSGCKGVVSKSVNTFFLPFSQLLGSPQEPVGFRLPPKLSLPSLVKLNLSYCNLSENSMPTDFSNLSSLIALNLDGNNFVSTPSCISQLPKLELLGLNCCEMLQTLPEFQSSMRLLDATNCGSFETSESNLSRPCSLFASHPQRHSHLPRALKSYVEVCTLASLTCQNNVICLCARLCTCVCV
jgi:Leucine-rich repeat (LRR) protein